MTGFDLSTASDIRLGNNPVEVYLGSNKIWPAGIDYLSMPLTFECVSNGGTISWICSSASVSKTIQYRKNNEAWTSIQSVSGGRSMPSIQPGDIIQVRGSNAAYATNTNYNYFRAGPDCIVYGNIMSLIDGDNFANLKALTEDYAFMQLFSGNFIDVSNLQLPATTLTKQCYRYMLADLTKITSAPVLPAKALPEYCYYRMFSGCTRLNYVKCLAETGINNLSSTYYWLYGVSSTGTFVKSPKANVTSGSSGTNTQWPRGNNGIPINWLVEDAGDTPQPTLLDPEISWGAASYSYQLDSSSKPVFNNPNSVSVTFSSSNTSIATINSSGVVTYKKRGTVTLTAAFSGNSTYYSKTVTCSLTLTGYSSGIGWSAASYSYAIDSSNKPVFSNPNSVSVTFSSSNTGVATIDSSGVVTYVAAGTTTLTATFNGDDTYEPSTVTCTLEVTAAVAAPLTFTILSSGNIGWRASSGSNTRTIQYRKNNGSWTNITSTTAGATISVANGDKIEFKANNTSIGASGYYNYFTATCTFKAKGYLTSILDADNYDSYNTYGADNMFRYLFYDCTGLTDASEMILPTTTRNGCYSRMFQGCTGLVKGPDLLAATIETYAYYHLFDGCSSLNYVKCLATSGINTSSSTTSWLNGVASSGTFIKASGSSWPSSTSGIPSSWTQQTAS